MRVQGCWRPSLKRVGECRPLICLSGRQLSTAACATSASHNQHRRISTLEIPHIPPISNQQRPIDRVPRPLVVIAIVLGSLAFPTARGGYRGRNYQGQRLSASQEQLPRKVRHIAVAIAKEGKAYRGSNCQGRVSICSGRNRSTCTYWTIWLAGYCSGGSRGRFLYTFGVRRCGWLVGL
jgi:hypothetical protein